MPFFKTEDGCTLYYELLGDGPGKPFLTFLNGTLQTTVYWKSIAKSLEGRWRLLLYDARGQGESELGDTPLSLKLHCADLKALLYALNIHETNLVGISHGARVALTLADESPNLISRMVLCSISTRSPFRAKMIVRSWHEILQRHSLDAMVWAAVPHVFGRNYLKQNEKILERMVQTIARRNKTEGLRAHLAALQNYPSLSASLSRTPFLVLVLSGEDDPLGAADGAEVIARICGGRHVQLPGIGHSIPAEAPEEFVRLISDFLRNPR
jgi:pimeloyl-ACP methyl ester carboxylesterase